MNFKKLLNIIIIGIFFSSHSFFAQATELQCEKFSRSIIESVSDEDIYPYMEKRNDIGIIYDYECYFCS